MGNKSGKKEIFGKDAELENDYFYLVKQNLRRFYLNLKSNDFNNSIALEKKNFNKAAVMKSNYSFQSQKKKKKVRWKYYMINYFDKQRRSGTLWYSDIIHELRSYVFVEENELLSRLFYEDYEATTIPKCLISINNSIIENEKIIENAKNKKNPNNFLFESVSENSRNDNDFLFFGNGSQMKTHNSLSTINLTGVTNNLGGSFGSGTESESSNELSRENKSNRKRVKQIIKLFKSHLLSKDEKGNYIHPIYILIKIFEKKISFVIRAKVEEMMEERETNENEYESNLNLLTQEIVRQIQKFIIKTQTACKLFYSSSCDLRCFFEEKDELINLITSTLFSIGTIHDDIYSLFSLVLERSVEQFGEKLHSLVDLTPLALGVSDKFSLDESTIIAQNSLKRNSNVGQEEDTESDHVSLSNSKKRITVSESRMVELSKEFHAKNEINGYNTVFKVIRSIANNKIPIEKMMLVASISSEITECVNHFWKGMDRYITSQYLNINADELMSLFIYAIVQAQFPEILIHMKIISEFTSKTTKGTMIGYYNTTMEAAIEYIQKGNCSKLYKNQSISTSNDGNNKINNDDE